MSVVVLGLLTLDATQVVERVPEPNQKRLARSTTVAYGGPAANAAAAARTLGSQVVLYTMTGTGPLAQVANDLLERDHIGIRSLVGPSADVPLSTVLITESTGERAVVSSHGLVPGPQLLPEPAEIAGDVLLVDGHYLDAAIEAALQCRERGIPVILDGGSWKPGLERLMPLVEVAILSDDFQGTTEGARFVARSHGNEPIELWGPGGMQTMISVPAVLDVVDTLGAGDVLHGAFAHFLATHSEGMVTFDVVRECLESAAQVATYSCRFSGAHGWRDNWHL